MKKALMIICMFLGLFSTNASAQLKEVRGVQTRSVKYTEYTDGEEIVRWGYELKNENNYDVWVELELKTPGFSFPYNNGWKTGEVIGGVRDTKNITLKAGETYVWRCGERMLFGDWGDCHEKFNIVYKAYKKE